MSEVGHEINELGDADSSVGRSAAPSGLSHSSVSQAKPSATIADILDRAADLIEPEGAWTQGSYARDEDGQAICDGRDPEARCWCVIGALERASGRLVTEDMTRPILRVLPPDAYSPIEFNDREGRTQSEVVAKLREAAAQARTTGAA